MTTSASQTQLQQSYARARNTLAEEFLCLQDWVKTLRACFHNDQGAILWAYAASGHWKTEWLKLLGGVPPLFVGGAEPCESDIALLLEAACTGSMKFDDTSTPSSLLGTTWLDGAADRGRGIQRPFVVATRYQGATRAGTNCILARADGYRHLGPGAVMAANALSQVLVSAEDLWFHMKQVRWPITTALTQAGWLNPAHMAIPMTLLHMVDAADQNTPVQPMVDRITPVQNLEVVLADRAVDFLKKKAAEKKRGPPTQTRRVYAAELVQWMFPHLDPAEKFRAEILVTRGLDGRHGILNVDQKNRVIEYMGGML